MLRRFRMQRQRRQQADELYVVLVGQARQPVFFTELGVPDTLDGRFELVVLHVHALTRGLLDRGPAMADLSRAVMEAMIDDMDRTLREIGVGDMSVGRKVKQMAAAFYGRAAAYDDGMNRDEDTLCAAIVRNVYAGNDPGSTTVRRLAAYLRGAVDCIAQTPDEALLAGHIAFPQP